MGSRSSPSASSSLPQGNMAFLFADLGWWETCHGVFSFRISPWTRSGGRGGTRRPGIERFARSPAPARFLTPSLSETMLAQKQPTAPVSSRVSLAARSQEKQGNRVGRVGGTNTAGAGETQDGRTRTQMLRPKLNGPCLCGAPNLDIFQGPRPKRLKRARW